MINRVVILGRVLSTPVLEAERSLCHLELEVAHPCFPDGEVEPTRVAVRFEGEHRPAVIDKWVREGDLLQVSGHLAWREGALCVEGESFEFMNARLATRYFDQEARRVA
ncbi:MAG: hypothetical protein AB7N76_17585 [Planctomycetota bacterium]